MATDAAGRRELRDGAGMTTTLDDILPYLKNVKKLSTGGYVASCPVHDDEHPSMTITEKDGRLLVHCHSGCSQDAVLKEILSLNGNGHSANGNGHRPVTKARKGGGKVTARYEYRDAQSSVQFVKVRKELPDGSKDFYIERPGGGKGIGDAAKVLYNLPALLDETRDWEVVFFCEGEKDVDTLTRRGLLATTNHEGGLSSPLDAERAAALKGRVVYCLADNDDKGRRHAHNVARGLKGVARSVKVIELPDLPDKGDVSDWMEEHTVDELKDFCLMVPEWMPAGEDDPFAAETEALEAVLADPLLGLKPIKLADHIDDDIPEVQYRIPNLIARGQLTVLAGAPKKGKSWLMLQATMALDLGLTFLKNPLDMANVLYFALEDPDRRIIRRARSIKWRPRNAEFIYAGGLDPLDGDNGPAGGMAQVRAASKLYDVIIIDTLATAMSGKTNENDNAAMGRIMNELAAIAHEGDCALVVVHHTSKAETGDDPFRGIRGASSIRGAYDIGAVLVRRNDEREAVLHIEGRDIEYAEYTLRQADGGLGWESLGGGAEYKKIIAGRKIVTYMEAEGDGMTAEELAAAMKKSKATIYDQLGRAERDGLVVRKPDAQSHADDDDKPGRPADRWYLKGSVNAL